MAESAVLVLFTVASAPIKATPTRDMLAEFSSLMLKRRDSWISLDDFVAKTQLSRDSH